MLIPLRWLRDYVDVPVDVTTLAHDLTMSGTKIEAVHGNAVDIEGVRIGKVLETSRHPGADRLTLCRVDVGGELLHIVCGAPNVRAGLTVAVATVGAHLPGGVKIRKSKIRGETSDGMICSARELGLDEDTGGILELDAALTSGADFGTGANDVVLEAEITPNRPDCLSILGLAREVAALYGGPVRRPTAWSAPDGLAAAAVPVEIAAGADCGRYLGRVIRDVRIGPSPAWMQARLRSVGLNPINNVVDITNFVLFECGQPLHAFDVAKLRGPRIVVRRARRGERLRTLDDVDRALDEEILVIADAAQPVAIAGVMGGLETAVQAGTTDLLLEAAYFDPALVRSGRRQLGLSTDSSYRFERQADIEMVQWAADRATALFAECAAGVVREATADVQPLRPAARRVSLRVERCNQIVGTHLGATEMAALLERIELPTVVQAGRIEVLVPSFRRDLHTEIDLIEEVARVHGYERIAGDVLPPAPLVYAANAQEELLGRLRALAVGLGYHEVRTTAFMDSRDPERLGLPADDARRHAVHVANPLVVQLDTMRTSLMPGMLRVLRHNRNHDQEQLRFAQVDRVFLDTPGPLPGLPTEPEIFVLVAAGEALPLGWGNASRAYDLYDLKGDVESLCALLGVDTRWVYGYTGSFWDEDVSFALMGTCGILGQGGALRAAVLREFDLEPPVFAFEMDVAALARNLPAARRARELPRYPAVKRDLSVLVPGSVTYEQVHAAVREAGGAHLESLQCFDVFRGKQASDGERSLGLRLRFRDPSRTLTEADVLPALDAIVRRLTESLGVTLRIG